MTARERILARVRDALAGREETAHPGPFLGWRPVQAEGTPLQAFSERFTTAGGEVVRVPSAAEARAWLAGTSEGRAVALGATLPETLHPAAPAAPAAGADIGISMARGAVAETGSLVLDARDGRWTQLLPPVHVVVLYAGDVHETLAGALQTLSRELPSVVALHSGPSKSADIGQILVKGVHGPGRVIALVIDPETET